jgi:hypothetical protein
MGEGPEDDMKVSFQWWLRIAAVCAVMQAGLVYRAQAQTEIPDAWFITWFGDTDLYGAGMIRTRMGSATCRNTISAVRR